MLAVAHAYVRLLLSYLIPAATFLSHVYCSPIKHTVVRLYLPDGSENGYLSAGIRPIEYFHAYVVLQLSHLSLKMILFGSILFVTLCRPRRSLVPLFTPREPGTSGGLNAINWCQKTTSSFVC